MGYRQLVTPNIDTPSISGYCLGYVDNAIGAVYPHRSYSAQIAYNNAVDLGWVFANQNYPRNVWFVMFWSIDNSEQKGLGHVALAYVSENGNLQIHDSEVHRGARSPYGSLGELSGWFGSAGIQLTFLGWSLGCDNVKIIEDETQSNVVISKKVEEKKEDEVDMTEFAFAHKSAIFYVTGSRMVALQTASEWAVLQAMYTQTHNGKAIPALDWSNNMATAQAYFGICDYGNDTNFQASVTKDLDTIKKSFK